jgi:restriction system protein
MLGDKPNVHVPHYPTYSGARAFLKPMNGKSRRVLLKLRDTIYDHVGTPQETRDWTQPEEWIPTILEGVEGDLAQHLWRGSDGLINPRHLTGLWLLCSSYELFSPDSQDVLFITPLGKDFLETTFGEAERYLDFSEGLFHLLTIVAEHGPGKRADLLPHYTQFLTLYSRVQSQAAIKSRWYDRITNLVDRNLVQRDGLAYQITGFGLTYLEQVAPLLKTGAELPVSKTASELRRLLDEQNKEVRKKISDALRTIDPYNLEQLVKTLLEAMGYENVTVTRRSGDGGVDVVGDIRVGITYVREVIQVKRHQATIQRPILDQLRGSLHRFDAHRATIITTGNFSRGVRDAAFERGAAPVTLIDGERLIELFIEHEIGASKRSIDILDFVQSDFEFAEENLQTR